MELFKSQGISQEMLKRNFARNELLVDLTKIPDNIRNGVINKYNEENGKDRSKLFNYFISHNLKLLMDSVGDF
jgi:hypothetical protein